MRSTRNGFRLMFSAFLMVAMTAASYAAKPAAAKRAESESVTKSSPAPSTWAHIVLKGSYPEGAQLPGLFGSVTESLTAGLNRLQRAADDDRIAGVVLRINSPSIGWAKLNDFRQAIGRVRAKGKKVYAWFNSGSTKDYLLASACDKILMPEPGTLMMLGVRAEVSFYKNLFDKLSLKADMLHVGEFKSAGEPYTRTHMSKPFRQEMEEILDDYYRQIVEMVAAGRKLAPVKVKAAIDSGPHSAADAKKLGLIDQVAYEDELEAIIRADSKAQSVKLVRRYGRKKRDTDFSGFAGFIKLMNLMMGLEPRQSGGFRPRIAVIHADGMIMTGRSTSSLLGGNLLGSETIIKAVRKASADPKVKAIVLRVNSPGGSALASDLMWRAIEKVDKPFIVSMGDVAASGGYYISMGADRIFAEPGTLTGSIGVVGGKIALKGLYEKIGITTDVIQRGRNNGLLSSHDGFSASERVAMVRLLHETYRQFTRKAARGRHMKVEQLEKLARGRVYTGAMAIKIGLVDQLGTLEDAIAYAKRKAGLKSTDKIDRLDLPKPVSPFEALFGPLDTDARLQAARNRAVRKLLGQVAPELSVHLRNVGLINVLARERRLLVLPFRVRIR